MFKNKLTFITTGPSKFTPEIKTMVENFFNAIPVYCNADKHEDLEFFAEHGDALVLAGGSDIFRGTLGRAVTHSDGLSKFDIKRDRRELYLINSFVEQKKPILAICRGFQLLCARYGFPLICDLNSYIAHSPGSIELNLEAGEFAHYITFRPEYRDLYSNESLPVNSYHHQAIAFAQKHIEHEGISVVAVANTNYEKESNTVIAEVVESVEKKIVGMQFHPEADWMYGNEASVMVLNRFKQLSGLYE